MFEALLKVVLTYGLGTPESHREQCLWEKQHSRAECNARFVAETIAVCEAYCPVPEYCDARCEATCLNAELCTIAGELAQAYVSAQTGKQVRGLQLRAATLHRHGACSEL